jgi:hypothetical protein
MFVHDPSIAIKIQRMNQRVRWQHALIREYQIDQTRLQIDDQQGDRPDFSFLVLGDSGSGSHRWHNPQQRVADMLEERIDQCQFVMHTGDVVYLTGSSEYYGRNFIQPYHYLLVGGDRPDKIDYCRMVFKKPFLPVLGNHDYYDLPLWVGLLSQAALPLRFLFRSKIDFDVGRHGSRQGDAYARAFLDYLCQYASNSTLPTHLKQRYTAQWGEVKCLEYKPGVFTRLPNRYYMFRYGHIDFFALDSNTFNAPLPLEQQGNEDPGEALRKRHKEVEQQRMDILQETVFLNPDNLDQAERLDDLRTKLEYLEEIGRDIEKQLSNPTVSPVDQDQLDWLRDRLIESWSTPEVRGRVLLFHHPPYVTEATKWYQAQTLAVRERLRRVFSEVADKVSDRPYNQPIVDLVINGHAHCFEHLQTGETGYGDANIHWLVCGGSGYSLRRQRPEGAILTEDRDGERYEVARSHKFIGRSGSGSAKHRPYSCLQIDVKDGRPPHFVVRPLVSDRYRHHWIDLPVEPFEI